MIRGNVPKLTLGLAGGTQHVLGGIHVTGGLTEVSAAAWLMGRRSVRQSLHQRGAKDFKLNERDAVPRWFSLAIDHLRHRSGWNVVVLNKGREVTYRVAWMGRGAQRCRGKG